MTRQDAITLISRYYAAFNAGDPAGMLDCVAEDVEHRVKQRASNPSSPAKAAHRPV